MNLKVIIESVLVVPQGAVTAGGLTQNLLHSSHHQAETPTDVLYIFNGPATVCWPLLCLCRPFCIFDLCLDSNPDSCHNKQASYQLSHPSHYICMNNTLKRRLSPVLWNACLLYYIKNRTSIRNFHNQPPLSTIWNRYRRVAKIFGQPFLWKPLITEANILRTPKKYPWNSVGNICFHEFLVRSVKNLTSNTGWQAVPR